MTMNCSIATVMASDTYQKFNKSLFFTDRIYNICASYILIDSLK